MLNIFVRSTSGMMKYRIMSFDGGGIRGALTVTLLKRLLESCPELIKRCHMFAGTSTGSFIALGLAYGLSVDRLVQLYSPETGRYIFTPRYLELIRPKYDNHHLKEVLLSVFPEDLCLRDLERYVVIPAFRITGNESGRWAPVFFNNFPGSDTLDVHVVDAALASSAAPVYFPSYYGYIDGGVVANNPGTAAVTIARDAGGQNVDDICMLSLGTGDSPNQITADTTTWGAIEWALYPGPSFPILTVLLDGVVEVDTRFSRRLLGKKYFRLNPEITDSVPLDAYHKIPSLVSIAKKFDISPAVHWIEEYWF